MKADLAVNSAIKEFAANSKLSITAAKALALVIDYSALLLECVACTYYLVQFKKNQVKIQALLDFSSEINIITPTYIAKLDLKVQSNNIKAQKINDSTFKTFKMVLTNIQVKNMLEKARFFQRTFLVANISVSVILNMLFLIFGNINILFIEWKLSLRSYTSAKALPITKWV